MFLFLINSGLYDNADNVKIFMRIVGGKSTYAVSRKIMLKHSLPVIECACTYIEF